jgi:hypothetical protein
LNLGGAERKSKADRLKPVLLAVRGQILVVILVVAGVGGVSAQTRRAGVHLNRANAAGGGAAGSGAANAAGTACSIGGFAYSCDAYGGVVGTGIACNGSGAQVVGSVGYFHLELVANRWWFCDPSNNPWHEKSVYVADNTSLAGASGNDFSNVVAWKYGGSITSWANRVTARLKQEGFNTIGPYAGAGSHNMYPVASFGNGANATALPFIYHTDMASDCINALDYSIANVYYGQPYVFPDVFNPAMAACYTADLTATGKFFNGGNNSRMGIFAAPFTDSQKMLEAVWLGDTDFLMGFVASPATPDHGAGIHLGYGFATANPVLNGRTFYGKAEWVAWVQGAAEPQANVSCTRAVSTVTCGVGDSAFGPNDILTTAGCSDGSFNSAAGTGVRVSTIGKSSMTFSLAGSGAAATCTISAGPGYASVDALNAAWGAAYTAFASAGGYGKGSGLADETGSHEWFPQFANSAAGGLAGGNATSQNDLQNFMQRICNKYFQIGRDSIRSVFPSHLVTGPGFLSTTTYDQVILAAMHYVDLPEMWMEPKNAAAKLAYAYNLSSVKKPVVLWTNLSASGESNGLPNAFDSGTPAKAATCNITGGATNYDYASQSLRGQCYYQLMKVYWDAIGSDGNRFVVGERWWQLTDNYSEQVNYGLIDRFDNAYDAVCPVMAAVSAGDGAYGCGRDSGNYNSDFLGTVDASGAGSKAGGAGGNVNGGNKAVAGNLIWILAARVGRALQ